MFLLSFFESEAPRSESALPASAASALPWLLALLTPDWGPHLLTSWAPCRAWRTDGLPWGSPSLPPPHTGDPDSDRVSQLRPPATV